MFIFELFFKWISDFLLFAGFVSGNNTFPPSLTAEEEKTYVELLKNGDSDARKILIERNLRLVAHIAKKYSDESTLDDFISIGTIGMIKGIDTFDFSKNKRLSPYISRCIENEILMTLRSNKKRQGDISIDETIGTDKEGNSLSLSDILPAPCEDIADEIWSKIESDKLRGAIKKVLSPTETMIMYERYGLGNCEKKTQQEIADRLGISRSYVSRIEKKCLKKLFNELNT